MMQTDGAWSPSVFFDVGDMACLFLTQKKGGAAGTGHGRGGGFSRKLPCVACPQSETPEIVMF